MKVPFEVMVSGGPGPAPANTLNREQVVQRPEVREVSSVVARELHSLAPVSSCSIPWGQCALAARCSTGSIVLQQQWPHQAWMFLLPSLPW